MKLLRMIPFVALSIISLCAAATLSAQRRVFTFDVDLSPHALVSSLQKIEHYKASALIFVLAWSALGSRRLSAAFWLTMLVAAGWELFEATAVGRTARLSDLGPDLLGAFVCLVVAVAVRTIFARSGETSRQQAR